ncbi:MAG: hypothetical protein PVF77_17915 [Anaerolineae bacterium]|jgi:hypothetical protein
MDELPSNAELYEAFVPSNMARTRVAAMSFEGVVRMVSRTRAKVEPEEYSHLPLADEEIAGIIQDYARSIESDVDRQNWLLGEILEEQRRHSGYLRGVSTILIILVVFFLVTIISSCVLLFVQLPNILP